MRTMLLVHFPPETGNPAIRDGSIGKVIEKVMGVLKPEVSYFFPREGQRAFLAVFNLADSSDIAAALEPLWLSLNARVELIPVMTAEDLKKGLSRL